jgi:hypothetical protein
MSNTQAKAPPRAFDDSRDLLEPEALRELGMKSPHTLARLAESCAELDGEPLAPELVTKRVKQRNQWGLMTRPYICTAWPKVKIERFKARTADIKAGRFIDKHGTPKISMQRSLAILEPVLPGINEQLLLKWARKEWRTGKGKTRHGCTYLGGQPLSIDRPGFVICPRDTWFTERQIIHLAAIIRRARKGLLWDSKHKLCVTPALLHRKFGWDLHRLMRWEEECLHHHDGQVTRIWFPFGPHNKNGRTGTWRWKDAREIARSIQAGFDGSYHEPDGLRYNLPAAAEKWNVSVNTLRRYRDETTYHPQGFLPTEQRRRRFAPFIEESTVLASDMEILAQGIEQALNEPAPIGWKTASEIADSHRLDPLNTRQDRITLAHLLIFLRLLKDRRLGAVQRVRELPTVQRRRLIWFYDAPRFEILLGGQPLPQVLRQFRNDYRELIGEAGPDVRPGAIPGAEARRRRDRPITTSEIKQLLADHRDEIKALLDAERDCIKAMMQANSGTNHTTGSMAREDGPVSPHQFCLHGRMYDGFSPLTHKLLALLWEKRLIPLPLHDAIDELYGDDRDDDKVQAITNLKKKLSRILDRQGCPLEISIKSKHLILTVGPG